MKSFFLFLAAKVLENNKFQESFPIVPIIIGILIALFFISTSIGVIYYFVVQNTGYKKPEYYLGLFWITNSTFFLYYGDSNITDELLGMAFNLLRIVFFMFFVHIIIFLIQKIKISYNKKPSPK